MTNSSMLVQPAADSSSRFVDFFDGRRGLRGTLAVEIREPASTPREPEPGRSQPERSAAVLDFISSNETLDRYDEVIAARGWRLENYRRNPVFQNAHQYGDVIFTLGKALITEVRGAGPPEAPPYLYQRIEFAVEVNPMARIAYGLYRGKFLNAVSVGFIPIRWESPAQPQKAGYRRKYLEQELIEVSAVGIPANPAALQLGLRSGAIAKADLKQLLELLGRSGGTPVPIIQESSPEKAERGSGQQQEMKNAEKDQRQAGRLSYGENFCSEMAAPNTDASASGVRSNEAQLLQLARALRDILRRT